MVDLILYTNKNAAPVEKIFDLFCDLASWRQIGDVAGQIYELISDLPFTAEEIQLIGEAVLDIVRDLPQYEGVRDILENLADYFCDLSMQAEWVEKAAGMLAFASQLPDYEGFRQVVKYVQEFMASPPEAQQMREMIYQLPVLLSSLPRSATLAGYINQAAEMLPALLAQPDLLERLAGVLDLFCDLSIQQSIGEFLQTQFAAAACEVESADLEMSA
ncbi:MAG: hypothetical protein ACUVTU_04940 [Desulfurispora sp.]|uniref:hypothetical protein n=1 Tax=Desulfurispora sp. TaxID=3014275 RepID=UPI0040494B85